MARYFAPAYQILVNGSELQADISKNVQQVQVVKSKPDTLDTFSLTIVNSFPEMRWTHTNDAELFRAGNSVQIGMGYVDDLQVLMEGEITQISPTFPESGTPTITITGHSRLHWLHGDHKTRTFQNMTDKQIAEKLGQEAGLEVKAEDAQVQYDYIMQPNQTDLQFLRTRAKLINFEVLVENKTLILRKAKETEQKIYTLVWAPVQQASLTGPNTLPLRSFSPNMDALRQVSQVQGRAWDPSSKQVMVGQAGPGDVTKMGGTQSGGDVRVSAFGKPRQQVRVTTPAASQSELDQQTKAANNESAMNLISGTATTIGVPELCSGSVVDLQGLGPRFSGQYYIEEATHTIGGDGYNLSFTVKRNSI
jgi:phage protein D